MSAAPDRSILQALAALERVLAKLDAPAMVIGGIAVIARGVPRSTVDVDATIWGSAVSLEELFAALETEAIMPRIPGGLVPGAVRAGRELPPDSSVQSQLLGLIPSLSPGGVRAPPFTSAG